MAFPLQDSVALLAGLRPSVLGSGLHLLGLGPQADCLLKLDARTVPVRFRLFHETGGLQLQARLLSARPLHSLDLGAGQALLGRRSRVSGLFERVHRICLDAPRLLQHLEGLGLGSPRLLDTRHGFELESARLRKLVLRLRPRCLGLVFGRRDLRERVLRGRLKISKDVVHLRDGLGRLAGTHGRPGIPLDALLQALHGRRHRSRFRRHQRRWGRLRLRGWRGSRDTGRLLLGRRRLAAQRPAYQAAGIDDRAERLEVAGRRRRDGVGRRGPRLRPWRVDRLLWRRDSWRIGCLGWLLLRERRVDRRLVRVLPRRGRSLGCLGGRDRPLAARAARRSPTGPRPPQTALQPGLPRATVPALAP